MKRRFSYPLFGVLAAAVVYACTSETPISPTADAPSFGRKAGQIAICHFSEEDGTYHSININGNAEAAHRAHGDGMVGDPVPGMAGYIFGEGCALEPPVCPTELNALASWYESSEYLRVEQIRMQATFENADPVDRTIVFSGNTFQIWSVPSVGFPPVVKNAVPSGSFAPGETFSYDLVFDVSGLPASDTKLAFRVVNNTQGTAPPSFVPLVSVSFTCE